MLLRFIRLDALGEKNMQKVIECFVDDCIERYPDDVVIELLSFLYDKTKHAAYLSGLSQLIEKTENDYDKFNQHLWSLNRHLAHGVDLNQNDADHVRYRYLGPSYFRILERLSAYNLAVGSRASEGSHVVIVSHCILWEAHSPTKMCLDIAANLTLLGCSVLLMNTNSLPRLQTSGFVNGFISNFNSALDGLQSVDYAGTTFSLFSNQDPILSETKITPVNK